MIEDDYKCLVMAAEDPFSPAENPDRYPFVVVPGPSAAHLDLHTQFRGVSAL